MKKKTKRILIFVICFLFVFSIYFSINTLAKYSSNVVTSKATDVAKWEVLSLNEEEETINLSPGGDAMSYLLRITSKSDVKTNYSIVITNLPDTVMVSIDHGMFEEPVNNTVTFSNINYYIDASDASVKEHIISFKAIDGAQTVADREIDLDVVFIQEEI